RGGPLRGRLYLLRCLRLDAYGPSFGAPIPLCHGDGTPLEVYGLAGPAVIAAADATAGFDLLVSDFLDRIWYFRGLVPTAADGVPRFAPRTPVRCHGVPVAPLDRMPVPPAPPADYPPAERLPDELILPTCMHALAVARWPGGAVDLVVGAEDGYVRAMRWTGRTTDGVPIVEPPARLQAYDAPLSVGAKACPTVVDLDGDGRPELLLGNAAGQVLLARHHAAEGELRYEAPVLVTAAGRPIWLMAGSPGTIQGPSEVKWGYVNPSAGDWPVPDATPCPAILCGDALGHNSLYLLTPDHSPSPSVTATRGRRLHVLRDGQWQPLVTRWRCRPQLVDWGDGETVYLQVDESGTLRCYRPLPDGPDAEDGTPRVAPLDVLRHPDGRPIRLDSDTGGAVGRLKLAVVDWDGDGLPDLLVGTNGRHPPGRNHLKRATVWLLRNTGAPGRPALAEPEILPLEAGAPAAFGGHSCVPAPAHFDSGVPQPGTRPDLLVGSENGRVYAYRRSYIEAQGRLTAAHPLS
ncbi:MAG TPA: hypothetical protein VHN78_02675, partial [Chloroflexota bacterium]|nr:hypothetical protein [Chloroflexota bacterium]